MNANSAQARPKYTLRHLSADAQRLAARCRSLDIDPDRRDEFVAAFHVIAASVHMEQAEEGGADELLAFLQALAFRYLGRVNLLELLGLPPEAADSYINH